MRIGEQGADNIIVDRGHLQESGTCQVWRQRDCREPRAMARSGLRRAVCGNIEIGMGIWKDVEAGIWVEVFGLQHSGALVHVCIETVGREDGSSLDTPLYGGEKRIWGHLR